MRNCSEPSSPDHTGLDHALAEDPSFAAFLDIIDTDFAAFAECLQAFDGGLHDRLKALVGDVEVDLDGLLSPDDE